MPLHDDIHNYYEHLLAEKINALGLNDTKSPDYIADLCCLALNQVPPRYIRFDVDMAFYLPIQEREKMEQSVAQALMSAQAYLEKKEGMRKN